MGEIPEASAALEELEAYYSTLPTAFKEKLHFGKKGIPGDFVNNYAGIYVHVQFIQESIELGDGVTGRDIDELNYYVSCMRSYRTYLESVIRVVLDNTPGLRVDMRELIVRLMDLPLIPELEANISEIKGMQFSQGPEFLPKLERLSKLVDVGVAIIRDTMTIQQLKEKFPGYVG